MSVLSARAISVSFGGVHAVVDVSIDVEPGQLVGLIGPNGAGKTTFIDALTGFVEHRGTVSVDGVDVTNAQPHVRARRGLARTWQAIELFDDLTVRENLTVSARHPTSIETIKQLFGVAPPAHAAVDHALESFGITHLAEATPTELTQGQRKLASVARALAAQPRVLLLDEPAAGLDAGESKQLGQRLRGLVDGGLPILLVDHDMGLVLEICDQLVVIEFGKVIGRGTPDEIRRNPAVVAAYLGSSASELGEAP